MRLLLLLGSFLLLAGCQNTPTWLGTPNELKHETFYFGEVLKDDNGWLWKDCVTGHLRPIQGKRTFTETPHGPISMLAQGGVSSTSPLEVSLVLGEETEGSCQEHGTASLTNTLWQMVAWPQQRSLNNTALQLLITEENTIRGQLGCYTFTGNVERTGNRIHSSTLSWAKEETCNKGATPEELPASFTQHWQASLYGNTLVLTNLQGESIYFRALYL